MSATSRPKRVSGVVTIPSDAQTPAGAPTPKSTVRKKGHAGVNQYGGRTKREKVDVIVKMMGEQHLSMEEFLQAYIFTPREDYMPIQAESPNERVKKLAKFLSNTEVLRAIARHLDKGTLATLVTERIRPELARLGGIKLFGKFDPDLPADQLQAETAHSQLLSEAPELTDMLHALLKRKHTAKLGRQVKGKTILVASLIRRAATPYAANQFSIQMGIYLQSQGTKRRVLATLAGLGVCAYPKSVYQANKKLHDMATRSIQEFGTDPNAHICFDNLDYMERTGQHGLHTRDYLRHLTTAKIFKSIEVPRGGLDPAWLHEDVPLQPSDITDAPGNNAGDPHAIAYAKYEIAECLRRAYPGALAQVFSVEHTDAFKWQSVEGYPHPPKLHRLATQRTLHTTMRLIFENEGSIEGTQAVLDDIFDKQLGQFEKYTAIDIARRKRDETESTRHHAKVPQAAQTAARSSTAFMQAELLHKRTARDYSPEALNADSHSHAERIRLVYGDQKTVGNLRSVRKESQENDDAYERKQWLLPVPGAFHLKMCFVKAIEDNFNGPDSNSKSTLLSHKDLMARKICPSFQPPHSHKERLIIDSYHARILAFAYEYLGLSENSYEHVQAELSSKTPAWFREFVDSIYRVCFSPFVRHLEATDFKADIQRTKSASKRNNKRGDRSQATTDDGTIMSLTGDEERVTHIRFIQTVETYRMLCFAIKHADIGLFRRVIDRAIVIFHAKSHKNYAFIMLWMKWLTDSQASEKRLQDAILANGFVNLAGRPDSWFEIDRANEFLNCFLKNLLGARRNGTFSLEKHLEQCTLLATHTGKLCDAIESAFGECTDTTHTSRRTMREIHNLANVCLDESLRHPNGATAPFYAMDLLSVGINNLLKETKKTGESQTSRLAKFNRNVVHHRGRVQMPDIAMPDIPGQEKDPDDELAGQPHADADIAPGFLGAETWEDEDEPLEFDDGTCPDLGDTDTES